MRSWHAYPCHNKIWWRSITCLGYFCAVVLSFGRWPSSKNELQRLYELHDFSSDKYGIGDFDWRFEEIELEIRSWDGDETSARRKSRSSTTGTGSKSDPRTGPSYLYRILNILTNNTQLRINNTSNASKEKMTLRL